MMEDVIKEMDLADKIVKNLKVAIDRVMKSLTEKEKEIIRNRYPRLFNDNDTLS